MAPTNKLTHDFEEQFSEIAKQYSLRMELVEACDWDEDAALRLYEKAFEAVQDLWEYSQHDDSLIKNNDDFMELLKANLPEQTTNLQAEVVIKIIDYNMQEVVEKARVGEDYEKERN